MQSRSNHALLQRPVAKYELLVGPTLLLGRPVGELLPLVQLLLADLLGQRPALLGQLLIATGRARVAQRQIAEVATTDGLQFRTDRQVNDVLGGVLGCSYVGGVQVVDQSYASGVPVVCPLRRIRKRD